MVEIKKHNWKTAVDCSRRPQNLQFTDFTSLAWRGRQREMHHNGKRTCSAKLFFLNYIFRIVAFSFSSSLLKVSDTSYKVVNQRMLNTMVQCKM